YQNPLGEGLATPELELVVGGGDPMDQMAGLGQSGLADAVPADLGDGLVEIVDREVVAEAAQDGADYHRIGVTLGEAGAELLRGVGGGPAAPCRKGGGGRVEVDRAVAVHPPGAEFDRGDVALADGPHAHDELAVVRSGGGNHRGIADGGGLDGVLLGERSEEHTSELQSRENL